MLLYYKQFDNLNLLWHMIFYIHHGKEFPTVLYDKLNNSYESSAISALDHSLCISKEIYALYVLLYSCLQAPSESKSFFHNWFSLYLLSSPIIEDNVVCRVCDTESPTSGTISETTCVNKHREIGVVLSHNSSKRKVMSGLTRVCPVKLRDKLSSSLNNFNRISQVFLNTASFLAFHSIQRRVHDSCELSTSLHVSHFSSQPIISAWWGEWPPKGE